MDPVIEIVHDRLRNILMSHFHVKQNKNIAKAHQKVQDLILNAESGHRSPDSAMRLVNSGSEGTPPRKTPSDYKLQTVEAKVDQLLSMN